jgi:hypothetical protein
VQGVRVEIERPDDVGGDLRDRGFQGHGVFLGAEASAR